MSARGGRSTITGRTRVVAVIGDPVSHSRSPSIHNAAFRALDLDFVYVALRITPTDLPRAISGIRALRIAGLNVTVPHKERIVALVDRVTPRARAIGAVNAVFRSGRELVGDNTDAEGFRLAVAELGVALRRKRVLLLGAGGSARAVAWTLVKGGVRRITVLNRGRARAAKLATWIRGLSPAEVETGGLGEARKSALLGEVDLVINATSIGLDGSSMPPLDLRALRPDCAVYDLVYGAPTPLVIAARKRKLRAADGRTMLVHQAARAFELWTGCAAPRAVMRRAMGRS